jgi:inner membrane protein
MFIAHLPTGYAISVLLFPRFQNHGIRRKAFLCAGIFGATVPDADLLYFYLADHRQHHHHSYITHFPVLWLGLLSIAAAWMFLERAPRWAALALVFSLNGLLHVVLDTVVGDIWWFAPFIDKPYAFFTVPDIYKPWWLNFILHWSFALELILILFAVCVWRSTRPSA